MKKKYQAAKEIAEKWGVSVRRVQMLCVEGKIPGAKKDGKAWMIPADAIQPEDGRVHNGSSAMRQAKKNSLANNLDFLWNMSYGLRSSLNLIIGYAERIRAHKDEAERVDEFAEHILQSGDEILQLTNNIIEIAGLRSGDTSSRNRLVFLRDLLESSIETLRYEAEYKHVAIQIHIESGCEWIYTDDSKVQCILRNLMGNAIRYSERDSVVTLEAEKVKLPGIHPRLRYTISDNGCGMSREKVEHLYDLLSNGVEKINPLGKGTGLGVALTKTLVDNLGGTMYIDSRVGEGTKVEVEIPTYLLENETFREYAEISKFCFSGIRLLLAEDNELCREMNCELLEECGISADVAEDGEECIRIYEEAPEGYYDLIVMDIRMPRCSGLDAARRIRSMPERKGEIPIIAMTAISNIEEKEEVRRAGVNGFLEKPIHQYALLREIEKVLEEKERNA